MVRVYNIKNVLEKVVFNFDNKQAGLNISNLVVSATSTVKSVECILNYMYFSCWMNTHNIRDSRIRIMLDSYTMLVLKLYPETHSISNVNFVQYLYLSSKDLDKNKISVIFVIVNNCKTRNLCSRKVGFMCSWNSAIVVFWKHFIWIVEYFWSGEWK
jgi:hypothetical protein